MTELLKFGRGNAKLAKDILTFSLPAGHSCPAAHACKACANPETGKITDGKYQQFRCFAASAEAAFPTVRESRWHNFTLLRIAKTRGVMFDLIEASLNEQKNFTKVRIHVSGDFYSQSYFDAWMDIAETFPDTTFYAYTKSLTFWTNRLADIPVNMCLVASHGGVHDHLIERLQLKSAKVVFSPEAAEVLNLEVDHDDSHAYESSKGDFALLLHGGQPSNSEAAAAIKSMKDNNVTYAYSNG